MTFIATGSENIKWIEKHCRVPEGKFVGKKVVLRDWQKKILHDIYDTPTRRAIISFGRKNAKALALDTPIPTPNGWRVLADIVAGDVVYGADGKPCRVLATSDVFVGKPCYKLQFSDGSDIVASGDHLWLTSHRYSPWLAKREGVYKKCQQVVTTEQIAASLLFPCHTEGQREFNHAIPVTPALRSDPVTLPLDPYLLGVWLGDGTSADAAMTCSDQDLPHFTSEVAQVIGGMPVVRLDASYVTKLGIRSCCWNLRMSMGRKKASKAKVQVTLRQMGVLGNKHIPELYFAAGTEQRRALLQGLMDTDGTIHANGVTPISSYTTVSKALAHQVWRLARTLGLKAAISEGKSTLNGHCYGLYYSVQFTAWEDDRIFRLPRKASRLTARPEKPPRSSRLKIVGCAPVPSVPTKCLMVDAKDSLFLAGYGCVATHNTTLSAFLLLLHLIGPRARPNSQLFSAAQSRDQASLLFNLAAKIVRMSPDLSDYLTVRDTAKQLYCKELGSLYRALSAEASTAYGLSPVFTVHDELGQVRGPRSELYEALETAGGAQEAPLSVIISTQAPTDADLLSLLIDDAKTGADPRIKLILYTSDPLADPFAPETALEANPALGDFLSTEEVEAQAESARRMPSREASFRNLVLNQRVDQVASMIPRSIWEGNSTPPEQMAFHEGPVHIGLDLSARQDLTALVAAVKGSDGVWNVKCEFFAPRAGLKERSRRDRAPYDLWADQGFLTLTPGASVDYDFVAERLGIWCADFPVTAIAYDRWRIDILKAELKRHGLELPLVEFGQGYKDMSPAVDILEAELLNLRVRHGGNPILQWCAANTITIADAAGNRKLDKSKTTGRIDGIVALAMAMAHGGKTEPVKEYQTFFY